MDETRIVVSPRVFDCIEYNATRGKCATCSSIYSKMENGTVALSQLSLAEILHISDIEVALRREKRRKQHSNVSGAAGH